MTRKLKGTIYAPAKHWSSIGKAIERVPCDFKHLDMRSLYGSRNLEITVRSGCGEKMFVVRRHLTKHDLDCRTANMVYLELVSALQELREAITARTETSTTSPEGGP